MNTPNESNTKAGEVKQRLLDLDYGDSCSVVSTQSTNSAAVRRAKSFASATLSDRPWYARLDPRNPSAPRREYKPIRDGLPKRARSRRHLRGTKSLHEMPLVAMSEAATHQKNSPIKAAETFQSETIYKFIFCFCGLQISYLSWAYLQEFLMTTRFEATANNPSGRFPSASFCVFLNRCVALVVALVAVRIRHGAFFSNNEAPIYVFIPCAISNTLSSISQYASLQYVSFPLMTVFKSSTIIPVMCMGYLIKGSTYPFSRYVEAAVVTAGVAIFSISSHAATPESSTPFGMMLLVGYVIFDSFTTQWQDKIYNMYGREHVDPYQMMLGVDTTAILFTTASLIYSGDLPQVLEFYAANPNVVVYSLLCPVMSACGQLCIFYTIKEFGPVVFTIIMTTRKLFSIGISSVVFGHHIDHKAAVGGAMVLGAILHSIHRSCQKQQEGDEKKVEDDQEDGETISSDTGPSRCISTSVDAASSSSSAKAKVVSV